VKTQHDRTCRERYYSKYIVLHKNQREPFVRNVQLHVHTVRQCKAAVLIILIFCCIPQRETFLSFQYRRTFKLLTRLKRAKTYKCTKFETFQVAFRKKRLSYGPALVTSPGLLSVSFELWSCACNFPLVCFLYRLSYGPALVTPPGLLSVSFELWSCSCNSPWFAFCIV
jgi:hypothetical protein